MTTVKRYDEATEEQQEILRDEARVGNWTTVLPDGVYVTTPDGRPPWEEKGE